MRDSGHSTRFKRREATATPIAIDDLIAAIVAGA
jgi:hypothetical protein